MFIGLAETLAINYSRPGIVKEYTSDGFIDSPTPLDTGNESKDTKLGWYHEEADTSSYIVGSVCGATVMTVLIWYIVMKVKESRKGGKLATAVSIRRLSHPL